ncbi:sulfite exporter TauE/SafE family protein, partial [Micromonospora sp. DH15]|nr:sulfite exporter TauE/SafE family protein [Micromonospora sp. DH15]
MELSDAALLVTAGLAAGTVNAVAGGGSLITFPAMIAAGLPPVPANVSNSVAVF